MTNSKVLFLSAMLSLSACGDDTDDTTASTDPTDASTSAPTTSATTSATMTTDATTGAHESGETSGHHESGETSGHAHDTTAADTGTSSGTTHGDTDGGVCDILGEGCHDNMTPEGIECHLVGHDGDVAACEKIFDMCAEICGL